MKTSISEGEVMGGGKRGAPDGGATTNSGTSDAAGMFTSVLSENPLRLNHPLTENHKRTEAYFPAKGLSEAIDVAMLLGQPLLLTGDPGTGKTRAAHWLADRLNVTPLLRCDVKSTSSGNDLLYYFDEVARFRDSSRNIPQQPLIRYLRLNALGEAILRAAGGRAELCTMEGESLEGDALVRHRDLLIDAFGDTWIHWNGSATAALLLPEDKDFAQAEPEHRIVLIDELDKAPRDTPNDLLTEIEDMRFKIPELGLMVKADPDSRPIVIITSNSEKSLPDPFLRRCIYFDIPFPRRYDSARDGDWPGQGTLEQIVDGRIDALSGGGSLLDQALDFFQRLRREDSTIRKRPGTAELLAWLDLLVHRYQLDSRSNLMERPDAIEDTLGAVVKAKDDLETARRILIEWLKPSR
jgi:MoxR-like ATPase